MSKVAAIVLTKDEEPRIEECLKRLKPYVDYILVLDGGSKDKTVEIAGRYADKVEVRVALGEYGEERNYARTLVPKHYSWVLYVDADEFFDEAFLKSLREWRLEEAEKKHIICFRFPRINLPDGKNYPDYQVRLHRNSRDIVWKGDHEQPAIPYLATEGIPLDQVDREDRMKRLGVATMDDYPMLHLPRRKDIRRPWW